MTVTAPGSFDLPVTARGSSDLPVTARGSSDLPVTAPGSFDLDRPWRLDSQVSIRPERFGALAYHFGTRRLSFLKSRKLLAVVEALAEQPSAREAFRCAGVTDDELPAYTRALQTLAASGMVTERAAATERSGR